MKFEHILYKHMLISLTNKIFYTLSYLVAIAISSESFTNLS